MVKYRTLCAQQSGDCAQGTVAGDELHTSSDTPLMLPINLKVLFRAGFNTVELRSAFSRVPCNV